MRSSGHLAFARIRQIIGKRGETALFVAARCGQSMRASAPRPVGSSAVGRADFVGDHENRLLIGVEAPVEAQALVPLVLAAKGDIDRRGNVRIEELGNDLAGGLLERQQLAERLSAQFLRHVAERPGPRPYAQKLKYSA